MVSASRPALANTTPTGATLASTNAARLDARISAYLVDSAVLLGFILVFFTAGGLILLLKSSNGAQDAPDSAYYAFMGVLLGGTIIGWTVFNVALIGWRGQTVGKYIMGIRATSAHGAAPGLLRATVRWFGLNPLLFHPLLLPIWGAFALLATFVTLSQPVFVVMLAVLLLWVVSPALSVITLLADPSRRALHDRLAGTTVVHVEPT